METSNCWVCVTEWGWQLPRWKKWVWWIGRMMMTGGKPEYSRRNPSNYDFIHHKSYMDWPGIEPGPFWWIVMALQLQIVTETTLRGSSRSSGLLSIWRSGTRIIALRLFVTYSASHYHLIRESRILLLLSPTL